MVKRFGEKKRLNIYLPESLYRRIFWRCWPFRYHEVYYGSDCNYKLLCTFYPGFWNVPVKPPRVKGQGAERRDAVGQPLIRKKSATIWARGRRNEVPFTSLDHIGALWLPKPIGVAKSPLSVWEIQNRIFRLFLVPIGVGRLRLLVSVSFCGGLFRFLFTFLFFY